MVNWPLYGTLRGIYHSHQRCSAELPDTEQASNNLRWRWFNPKYQAWTDRWILRGSKRSYPRCSTGFFDGASSYSLGLLWLCCIQGGEDPNVISVGHGFLTWRSDATSRCPALRCRQPWDVVQCRLLIIPNLAKRIGIAGALALELLPWCLVPSSLESVSYFFFLNII
jgi:hypothetical protein